MFFALKPLHNRLILEKLCRYIFYTCKTVVFWDLLRNCNFTIIFKSAYLLLKLKQMFKCKKAVVTELVCKINWIKNINVVIGIDEILHPLILFDALKVILCVALFSFIFEISMVLFQVESCLLTLFKKQ